jgi:hypothetical protein
LQSPLGVSHGGKGGLAPRWQVTCFLEGRM